MKTRMICLGLLVCLCLCSPPIQAADLGISPQTFFEKFAPIISSIYNGRQLGPDDIQLVGNHSFNVKIPDLTLMGLLNEDNGKIKQITLVSKPNQEAFYNVMRTYNRSMRIFHPELTSDQTIAFVYSMLADLSQDKPKEKVNGDIRYTGVIGSESGIWLSIEPVAYRDWYKGGNLFEATGTEWFEADYDNRLATAAVLTYAMLGDISDAELKNKTIQLYSCIDGYVGEDPSEKALRIAIAGALCAGFMKWSIKK